MHRKEFLKWCGGSCLSMIGLSWMAEGCTSVKYIQGAIVNRQLVIRKEEFVVVKNDKKSFLQYVIVKVDQLSYPVVVYRFSDDLFTALLMECPHQHVELNANGSILTCPAHGSEFDNKGEVLQGPAEEHLTSFRVTVDHLNVYVFV